jgi:8-oxo-dGTP pyrophosphatase MutT (NUDIX family)
MTFGDRRRLQEVLAARPAGTITVPGARAAAVLIPIVGRPEPSLVLTVRTDTLPSHRGQISFPGGSIDASDASPAAAALREAREEIGLDERAVRVLGELDTVETFVSGYVVTPVVGWLDEPPDLAPNPAEVARVIQVPIARLGDDVHAEPGFAFEGRTYPTEAWIVQGDVIWGVTARILRSLLHRLADAGLAARPPDTATPWPERSSSGA